MTQYLYIILFQICKNKYEEHQLSTKSSLNYRSKFHSFYNSPAIKYWYNVVFYSGFLIFFSFVLLTQFDPFVFGWDDIILCVWVTGCLCDFFNMVIALSLHIFYLKFYTHIHLFSSIYK